MLGQAFPDTISRTAAVVAPGLMVMGIIMFMGKISGAHLNPAVSIAFSLRGDFPWRRVPGYIVVQLIGATIAALFLREVVKVSAKYGSNYPASGYSNWQALLMEAVLTLGLRQRDPRHRLGRAEHRHLRRDRRRRLHRPGRTVGQPDLGSVDEPRTHLRPRPRRRRLRTSYWVYVVGPLLGAAIAVGFAYVLRGPGGGKSGSAAAQGDLGNRGREAGQGVDHPLWTMPPAGRGASLRS